MAEVGTYYITIMPSMSKFSSAMRSGLKSAGADGGRQYSSSFMDVLKGSAIGTMLGNLGSTLGGQLFEGLSVGIRRLDVLQNYPKVMQSLGYSAEEAAASIKLITEHLDGLPTTTQDMVTLTQSIADSTGDLDLATRAALGFNDMMLANGASAGEMTQAMGVFNRVLGKGNATTAQWMSIQSVMPAQLNMVARELLGESASAEDLRDALNDGVVSWDDFLGAIVKLDEEGTGKVASFADQARANVDGIGTALENVPNRIGQGWAKILEAFGRSNISGIINNFSYGVRDAMEGVAKGVEWLVEAMGKTDIAQHFSEVMGKVGEALSGLWKDGGPDMLRDVAQGIIDLIDGALDWLAANGDAVTTAVWAVVGALSAFAGIKLGTWITTLPATFTALSTALMANPFLLVAGAVATLVMALYGFFTQTETGRALWEGFCTTLSNLWTGLQEDFAFMTQRISEEWESFKTWVSGIPAFWQGIVDGVIQKGQALVAGLKQKWDKALQDAKTTWKNIGDSLSQAWQTIKTVVGTAVGLVVSGVRQKWDEAKTATSTAWEAAKTAVREKVEGIRSTIVEKIEAAKTAVTERFEAIKTAIGEKLQGAWNNVTQKVTDIKNGLVNGFTEAKNTVLGVFDGIKSGIEQKIQAARDFVSGMIENIKGLFNFSWSLPRPSLPHINWHWMDIGGLLQIPVFDGISWYAKGGLFTGAAVIGIGEAGDEAALPLNDSVYSRIAAGISRQMGGAQGVVVSGNTFIVRKESDIDAIADALYVKWERERKGAL